MSLDVAATETDPVPHRDLVELSARFSQAYLRWLDESPGGGLTYPRLRILETLHCQGPAKMRTLADSIGLSARNMTALADSLEADGLVRRTPHPTDRRITLLELTDDGMSAAGDSLTPRLVAVSSVFDDLSDADRARLQRILEKLVDVMAHTECSSA